MRHLDRLACVSMIRALERSAIATLGGDGFALMQRAGEAAWRHTCIHHAARRRWLVCCGTGNNGGDGYLLAAHAARAGFDVRVVRLGSPSTEDARRAAGIAREAGVEFEDFSAAPLPDADLMVDAVLGIGLTDAPREQAARLIDAINAHPAPVLALDVASGVDADTGHTPGACIQAQQTLTFLAHKPGLNTGDGLVRSGAVTLACLGVESVESDPVNATWRLYGRAADEIEPPRGGDHKGRRGHAVLIGGDDGMGGAVILAGEACARAGAGRTTLFTREQHVGGAIGRCPGLMVRGINVGALQSLRDAASKAEVLAIGPGLGTSEWSRALLDVALDCALPRIFDADALNLLSQSNVVLTPDDILTPHPGEAARLLGMNPGDIARDRVGAARRLARGRGAVVVLKGAGSVIAEPDGRIAIAPHAVPALATAGSGDVLTGMIAGLRAQGMDAFDAACTGVLAHAECGMRLSAAHGARGHIASDLAAHLPAVLNR